MAYLLENGDELVDYIKSFTGSTNDEEIKQCIFLAEMAMRNIELPALRTDPYTTLGTANAEGNVPIPSDMNKPIQFFNQGNNGQSSTTGPWIVYDRIGDRDMLGAQLVAPYYLNPTNVPAVIRGKFAEVGQYYSFLPLLGEGSIVNLYYYKAWPLLFTPITGGTPGQVVESNVVLQSWPEGYIYGTMYEYYVKRHNSEDAAIYKAKFDEAWRTVENQNNLSKWNGGHTRMTSIFQPRTWRQYSVK
jgi:hypothetical protein